MKPVVPPTTSRRDAILAAALAAFTENGVAGASVEEIRRRADASIGSIYHHFGSKEAIAEALRVEGLANYQEGFLQVLAESQTTRAGIEDCVHHHVTWIAENRDLARFLLLGPDTGLAVTKDLNRRFFGAVRSWMQPRIERGELRALEPELTSALWIGPSHELARHWLSGRTRISLSDTAPALAAAAWNSLKQED